MKTPTLLLALVFFIGGHLAIAQSGLTSNSDTKKIISIETTLSPTISAPSFEGGQEAMADYTEKHLVYPAGALKKRLEGTVIVTCYVNEDGSITNAHVSQSVCRELDKAAIKFVEGMPHWIPAMQNHVPKRVKYSIPVTYQLTF